MSEYVSFFIWIGITNHTDFMTEAGGGNNVEPKYTYSARK